MSLSCDKVLITKLKLALVVVVPFKDKARAHFKPLSQALVRLLIPNGVLLMRHDKDGALGFFEPTSAEFSICIARRLRHNLPSFRSEQFT